MMRRPISLPFRATDPLGLPRPIDPANVFGAKMAYFMANLMPVPTGCLAHFDHAVFRPYLGRLVRTLASQSSGWSGPAIADEPPRYVLLRHGKPARIPDDLAPFLPLPPQLSLGDILDHFEQGMEEPPVQLLDMLSLIREDVGLDRFLAATAGYVWLADFMR